MSARQELDSYIRQLERRVRLDTLSRGAAILASAALGATVVLVLLANARAFSDGSVVGARLVLICVLAFAASLGLAIPIRALEPSSRRRESRGDVSRVPAASRHIHGKRATPSLSWSSSRPTRSTWRGMRPPAALAPNATLLAVLGTGIVAVGVLVWLIIAGPGFLGYGTHLLWTGSPRGARRLCTICKSAPETRPSDVTPISS